MKKLGLQLCRYRTKQDDFNHGFTMENYAHGGRSSADDEDMGVFTIYDCGNGTAS
jgi:hypothetical protein